MGVKNLGDMDRPGNNVAALFTEYVRWLDVARKKSLYTHPAEQVWHCL
jgi:hypothetical protein